MAQPFPNRAEHLVVAVAQRCRSRLPTSRVKRRLHAAIDVLELLHAHYDHGAVAVLREENRAAFQNLLLDLGIMITQIRYWPS